MNDIYLYQYPDGKQFLSTGNPFLMDLALKYQFVVPKVVGRWRYKKMKMPIPDNSHLFRS